MKRKNLFKKNRSEQRKKGLLDESLPNFSGSNKPSKHAQFRVAENVPFGQQLPPTIRQIKELISRGEAKISSGHGNKKVIRLEELGFKIVVNKKITTIITCNRLPPA